MAATDIIFTGLQYLNGVTVSVCIAGLDCGDFRVSSGQITVPLSSNPNLSSSFLANISAKNLHGPNLTGISIGGTWYFVPVVIGRKYTSTGQMMRPMTQKDLKSQTGDGLGHKRRGYQYSFLFSKTGMGYGTTSSGVFSIGTGFFPDHTMWPVNLRKADGSTAWAGTTPFNGVHWDGLDDADQFDTMLTWTVSRPIAVTIEASAVHLHSEDR